jgi:putative flippase GtrA
VSEDPKPRWRETVSEAVKFGTVGLTGVVIDVGLFRIFRVGFLHDHPLTAAILSSVIATVFAYIGNRFWSFKSRAKTGYIKEFILFALLNVVAIGISTAVLAFTHYGLGYTTVLEDTVSAKVIGLGLGTLFRWWAYRKWVFRIYPETDALTAELQEPV